MDFVAIDFETANAARSSPCAIGVVEVKDGAIAGRASAIIRPPEGFDEVDPFNEVVHGITQEQVDGAPAFEDLWPSIRSAISGQVVVAHNAAFDMGVLRDTLDVIGEPWPDLSYVCTMVVSRRALDLDSYRLPFVADALGIPFNDHHDAEADSEASAMVLLRLAERQQTSTPEALLSSLGVRRGELSQDAWSGCHRMKPSGGGGRPLVIPDVRADADPDHPLYGLRVCFTGSLQTMVRQEAWDRLAAVGGTPEKGVTKKTNVLVVGAQNPNALRPGADQSAKERKASALRSAGQDIEIMGEDDFSALVADTAIGGLRKNRGGA